MSDENIREKTISLLQFRKYCEQKVMKLRFKNREGAPETFEGWLEQCKKYLTEEEFKRYVSKERRLIDEQETCRHKQDNILCT